MPTQNNPFVVYGYKGVAYFCDREKETEKMISTLHNERNVAPRRMGKTALKALVDKQLVDKTPKGYLVSDRFFAKWLVNGEG